MKYNPRIINERNNNINETKNNDYIFYRFIYFTVNIKR